SSTIRTLFIAVREGSGAGPRRGGAAPAARTSVRRERGLKANREARAERPVGSVESPTERRGGPGGNGETKRFRRFERSPARAVASSHGIAEDERPERTVLMAPLARRGRASGAPRLLPLLQRVLRRHAALRR